jgi:hypothetical protein
MGAEATRSGSTLALDVRQGEPPHGWNDAVTAAGGAAFHTVEWARHKCHGGAGDPLYVIWREENDGTEVGRALGIRRPSRDSRLGQLASKLIFDSPPAASNAACDFVSPVAVWAKDQPALLEVSLGSLDARSEWTPGVVPNAQRRREYLIRSDDVAGIWSGMSRAAHRNIKRAAKAGLETRPGTTADLADFARLYRSTLERLKGTKDVSFHLDDESFRESLRPLLDGGRGHLYLADRDGEAEAGWFFIALGDAACAVYSGTTESGRKAGGNSSALYDALCDLRQRGAAQLNLGGASWSAVDPDSPDHGLHEYKTRFGAVPEERFGGMISLRPWRARLIEGVRRMTGR